MRNHYSGPCADYRMAKSTDMVKMIDKLLPQTHCRKCGFDGCRPYATALADNKTDINRCPPGGDSTINALAKLLKRDIKVLDPETGEYQEKQIAMINESECIGCTLCIQVCPVDAIVGAAKQMHTVIIEECTGCDLCLAPCPVDCIEMFPIGKPTSLLRNRSKPMFFRFLKTSLLQQYHDKKTADNARLRYEFRLRRITKEKHNKEEKRAGRNLLLDDNLSQKEKKAVISAAIRRVKNKKAQYKSPAC